MTKVLELEKISKEFNNQKALDKVSFTLNKGEIVGLVGPNGAGKTTLMRIIVGLTKRYEGKVRFQGERSIGCVIETPSFYPYMTGFENLKYFAELNGVRDKQKVLKTAELLGLSDALKKKVKGYSLGMRQRLGIAQALLSDPELLILDEPTNGLDPTGIHELREYIKNIAKERNITVLISSHILSELEKLCNKAIIIKNGAIIDTIDLTKDKATAVSEVAIEVEDTLETSKVLRNNNITVKKLEDSKVYVDADKDFIPVIMELLVKNHIKFYSVKEEVKTLEDTFLDLMNENKIS
ncbi:ABC transporter ATP-binding protein [Inconstantimicrobium mannanitabidum]|uniref:ABC transporter ATP-binding protein n=1 Tax=Inconstantimicrobium mannanitabidum TaxID=1604901 RepID=A0ACB5RIK3_9CLOT|nr:ABC transporter ATP-binding protein [Clostridium sp. TW13]GKX68930.1 ABC transporter ATP-binding protein [Clostridium sp. TW13]